MKGRSLNSQLTSLPDCQSIIKKAVVERLKSVISCPGLKRPGRFIKFSF